MRAARPTTMASRARGSEGATVVIPSEIITEEIFPKLPAKSLVRFKCVSKSYNTLISSPKFVAMQLRESLSSDANRLLILADKHKTDLYSIDIDSPSSATSIHISLPRALEDWLEGTVSIVGSYNGLLCVGVTLDMRIDNFHKHVIINPSISTYKVIPDLSIPVMEGQFRLSSGFGFDEINHDYKLVKILQGPYTYFLGDMGLSRKVVVYSLKKNTWKSVDNIDLPNDQLNINQNGVLMKNHLLHWVFWGSEMFRITCFDVQSEAWVADVPFVDKYTYYNFNFYEDSDVRMVDLLSVGVVHGCLCLLINTHPFEVVWIMKEYGVKDSWVKLYDFFSSCGPWRFCFYGSFGFQQRSRHEILVREADKSGLDWCDIRSKTTFGRTDEIKGVPEFVEACFFKGSLVPIPGGHQINAADRHKIRLTFDCLYVHRPDFT